MPTTDTVVIGAGHAGLAVSNRLTAAGRDHVVLDRGQGEERWRSERWDSLHLLTPNWMTRLPGWSYTGPDSEGYMAARQFISHLERYAESFAAPVLTGTTVLAVTRTARGYRVVTDQGSWNTRHVVVATGPWGKPRVPDCIESHAGDLHVTTASAYRNPDALPDGGVLVVGASSSGVQIADELARTGRHVALAVGRHTRMPRRYRGMDIFWWLERTGRLSRTIDDVRDPVAARNEPSLQLMGRNEADRFAESLDLASLAGRGVRVAGRVHGRDRARPAELRGSLLEYATRELALGVQDVQLPLVALLQVRLRVLRLRFPARHVGIPGIQLLLEAAHIFVARLHSVGSFPGTRTAAPSNRPSEDSRGSTVR